MPDTGRLHKFVRSQRDFEWVISELDDERVQHEFSSAVEGVGRKIASEIEGYQPEELSEVETGWLWLLWEAYHSDEQPAKLEKGAA